MWYCARSSHTLSHHGHDLLRDKGLSSAPISFTGTEAPPAHASPWATQLLWDTQAIKPHVEGSLTDEDFSIAFFAIGSEMQRRLQNFDPSVLWSQALRAEISWRPHAAVYEDSPTPELIATGDFCCPIPACDQASSSSRALACQMRKERAT